MDDALISLLTRAARAGAELNAANQEVRIRGLDDPDILDQLHHHRTQVRDLLLADHCAACNQPTWIHEADTAIPWCRTHATARGLELLRHEHPKLLEH